MQKLSDLAKRADFNIGPLFVAPARRLVRGPGGEITLEPLVMQVFLLLLDTHGEVVTREQLFDQIWGGVIVGDDSLNRAVAKVRRIDTEVGPGLFEIETIPRTGYRLVGELSSTLAANSEQSDRIRRLPRRTVMAGAVAAAGAGGLGLWFFSDSRKHGEFAALMERGAEALAYGDPVSHSKTAQYFRRAVALRPDNARAQGLFAYTQALRADNSEADEGGAALKEAEYATRAALSMNPRESNAQLAEVLLQRSMLDFASTEDRLREILRIDPFNNNAMRQLWNMLQCVGRSRDALALVDRALSVAPLGAANHFPRAQLLWILGRIGEADRVIDRAMQYWPSHRFVRFARFTIYAFTGRPRAALAMLEEPELLPFTPAGVALWRINLAALDRRTPSSIAAAVNASLDTTRQNLRLASQAILALSALGQIDAAFEMANALFAVGVPQGTRRQAGSSPASGTAWRFAPWLFTPPTAALRADPRFDVVCDEIGLTGYWAKRRIVPDYKIGIS